LPAPDAAQRAAIAAGISLVIIAVVNGIGGKLGEKFGLIDTKLAPAAP
jgi:Flp pilus assembly pilin Flp